MSIWLDDSSREDSTTETRDTFFGVPLLIVSLTFAMPVVPFIAYLLGPSTINGIRMWFMEASGLVWIGGFVLLMVIEVVSNARKTIKRVSTRIED